jgi:hypothetical protein
MRRKLPQITRYNQFLKAAKSHYGISHRRAQAFYRNLRDRLDRPARARDLSKHPRIAKTELSRSRARPYRARRPVTATPAKPPTVGFPGGQYAGDEGEEIDSGIVAGGAWDAGAIDDDEFIEDYIEGDDEEYDET